MKRLQIIPALALSFSTLLIPGTAEAQASPPVTVDVCVSGTTQDTFTYNPDTEVAEESLDGIYGIGGWSFGACFGSLSGTVAVVDGTPIEGVIIELFDEFGAFVFTTTTDAVGNYAFTELPFGSYSVIQAQPDFYANGSPNTLPSVQVFEAEATGIDFVEDFGSISGTVEGELGEVVPGATVTLTGTDVSGEPVMLTTTSDTNGAYLFENLLDGDYAVSETLPVVETPPQSGVNIAPPEPEVIPGRPVVIDIVGENANTVPNTVRVLSAGGNPVTSLAVSGEGIWSVDTGTGMVTFLPENEFIWNGPLNEGETSGKFLEFFTDITYTVETADGELLEATITISYVGEEFSTINDISTGNTPGAAAVIDIFDNDFYLSLASDVIIELDANGLTGTSASADGHTLTVPGEGTWQYDSDQTTLTFTPETGFTENPSEIRYIAGEIFGGELYRLRATVNATYLEATAPLNPPIAAVPTPEAPTPVVPEASTPVVPTPTTAAPEVPVTTTTVPEAPTTTTEAPVDTPDEELVETGADVGGVIPALLAAAAAVSIARTRKAEDELTV